jgi:hypothetical protein
VSEAPPPPLPPPDGAVATAVVVGGITGVIPGPPLVAPLPPSPPSPPPDVDVVHGLDAPSPGIDGDDNAVEVGGMMMFETEPVTLPLLAPGPPAPSPGAEGADGTTVAVSVTVHQYGADETDGAPGPVVLVGGTPPEGLMGPPGFMIWPVPHGIPSVDPG